MIEIREENQEDYDAVRFVINQAFGTPEEGFMVMILNKFAMTGISGAARYRSEFDEAMKMPDNSFNADVNSASLHPPRLS